MDAEDTCEGGRALKKMQVKKTPMKNKEEK